MAAAERAGWGRGARRSESTRAGGGSEPGAQPGTARSRAAQRSPPPGTWPRRAVQVRAGGRRRAGPWLGGGTRAARGGAAGPGDPLAQVGVGSRGRRGRRRGQTPARAEGARRARVLPVPTVTSWDTTSPSPRLRCKGPGLLRPVQPGCGRPYRLLEDPASPGAGAERLSRGRRSTPCSPNQGAPLVLPLAKSRTRQSPAPSSGRRPRFLLGKEGCPTPHPSDRPAPSPHRTPIRGGRVSGAQV